MINKSEKIDELVKAVAKVMLTVDSVEKNSQVGSGRSAYKGTQDKDVKMAFKNVLSDNGLIILPVNIDEKTKVYRWEEIDTYSQINPKPMKTKQSVFTKATVTYMLAHESGQWVEVQGFGHGIDTQDKGAGKVTTYALKNLLLYSFLTPVGDIDDTDSTHSNEHATPQQRAQQNQPAPQQKPKLVKDDNNWKLIVDAIKEKKLKSLDNLNVIVDETLQKELQTLLDKQKPKLVKDSDDWKKIEEYITDGKLTKIEQVTKRFQSTKTLLKEVQKLIDDKVGADALEEQLAKEQEQKNGDKDGRLPNLTDEAFKEAMKLTDKLEITKVLNTHRMSGEQRTELAKKLK